MSIVLGIPLALVLWNHATPVPLQTFLFTTLVVYALDLCRLQDWTLAAVWVGGGVILPATNLFLTILGDEGSDGNEGGIGLLYSLLRVFVESLLFLCVVSTVVHRQKCTYAMLLLFDSSLLLMQTCTHTLTQHFTHFLVLCYFP